MTDFNNDTICAISTAPFVSAIGVIRVSGKDCYEIVERSFDKKISGCPERTLIHGYFKDGEKVIDEVVLALFKGPRSYTGEDVIEISAHGSTYVLNEIIHVLIKNGARLAQRGEFSKRAFINGKIDIVKAESIIDLIESQTRMEADVAIEHIKGRLSKEIESIRQDLLNISGQIMASIDYPDDEIEDLSAENLNKTLKKSYTQIQKLKNSFSTGRMIKNGISVCIVGKPNVGKSSILNAMAGYDRSIVTSIEGTTRDIVEEVISVDGFKVKVSDTAGIRESEDYIEMLGVKKTKEAIQRSDLVLFVLDSSSHMTEEDRKVIKDIEQLNDAILVVFNKSDIGTAVQKEDILKDRRVIHVSALKNTNIDQLKKEILSEITMADVNDVDIITNERQYECLDKAEKALDKCINDKLLPPDVLEIYIEDAIDALSSMLGKSVSDEILTNIFSRFCVGK